MNWGPFLKNYNLRRSFMRLEDFYRATLTLAITSLLCATPLLAQSTLTGQIADPEGRPIPGAKVTVRPLLDDTLRFSVNSDENGRYVLENFNPSRGYRFSVGKEGFRATWRDVEVGLDGTSRGSNFRQDFVLYPAGLDSGDRDSKLVLLSRYSPAAGIYQKGQRSLERGDLEKALKRFEAARELDEDLAPVHESLAIVYHKLGRHQEALAAADRALEIAPGDPDFLRVRYDALMGLGNREEARKAMQQLADAAASPAVSTLFFNQGVDAARTGDHDLAEIMFQGALRLDPEMRKAKESLAKVYIEARKYESAAAMAGELLEEGPPDLDLLRIRHQAFSALGDGARARQALQGLVQHDPGPRTATLLYNEGVAAFNSKKDSEAEELFQLALQSDPGNQEARLGLAEVLLRQRKFELCLETLEPILAKTPDHSHATRVRDRAVARMKNP